MPDAPTLQRRLEEVAAQLGRKYRGPLAAGLTITSGDELQALLREAGPAFDLIFDLAELLHPAKLRFGVSRGPLDTPLRPTTASLAGPVFYRAREALESAKRRGWSAVFAEFGDRTDTLSVLADCALAIVEGWTPSQRAAARAYLRHGTHEAAARELGVARSTVTRSLQRGLVAQVVRCRDQLRTLLGELE